jgi:hypothetical protein
MDLREVSHSERQARPNASRIAGIAFDQRSLNSEIEEAA